MLGTPSAVVVSDDSPRNASTPREPRVNPRSVRATSAGRDCGGAGAAVVVDVVADAVEFLLAPVLDALPSPALGQAAEEEDGPAAGEKSPLPAAFLRIGERGEDGILFCSPTDGDDEERASARGPRESATVSEKGSTSRRRFPTLSFFFLCPSLSLSLSLRRGAGESPAP